VIYPACPEAAGRVGAERWEFLRSPSSAEGRPPADDIFAFGAARSQYLLDLLAQVPDSRKRRGRRHSLAVGIAAVIAGSRSFAAIGQWAADAGPEALAVLGAASGPADESTFRRAFTLVSPDVLDRVLGAWLHTRAVQAGGRLVIAVDGKTAARRTRQGRRRTWSRHWRTASEVLGQVAVEDKSNEIPAVRDLLKAFASLAAAAFPDVRLEVLDQVAEGDLAATRVVMTGTQKEEFYGVPATGAVGTLHVTFFDRVADGKIVEHWADADVGGFLQQLSGAAATL
jgi:predicted ester cyclase